MTARRKPTKRRPTKQQKGSVADTARFFLVAAIVALVAVGAVQAGNAALEAVDTGDIPVGRSVAGAAAETK